MEYNIREDIFQKIYDFLTAIGGIHIKDRVKTRIFLEAAHYFLRTGCQVRLLPKEYGACFSIYQRFLYWKRRGVWEKLFEHFQDVDGEYFMMDATIIRANQCSAGYKKGSDEALARSCGGFSTKIHALVDALGNPVKFVLTGGNEHEITHAEELAKDLQNTSVLADRGYVSEKFEKFLQTNGCVAVIPSKTNQKVKKDIDKFLYEERHLVEFFFNKMKFFRRLASRFCKSASSFLAFLHFFGALICLK